MNAEAWRTLAQHHPLWTEITRFLWDPLKGVDPDRLRTLFAPLTIDPEHLTPAARRTATQRLGITPYSHAFPTDDGSRFLLLSMETLTHLAQWLGALAHTKALRSIVEGERVRQLHHTLPHLYPTLLHELGWFMTDLPRLQSVVDTSAPPSIERLEAIGWKLLYAHLAHLPHPLLHRFRLRFPQRFNALFEEPLPWEHHASDILRLQRLLKRISAEDTQRCCC